MISHVLTFEYVDGGRATDGQLPMRRLVCACGWTSPALRSAKALMSIAYVHRAANRE